MEEGRYRQNKRQGYWKLYNRYGTVRDSVEYKNDVPVVN
jgi:antitoxin component YwqK of YwqJK toxin-antitoxin module